MDPLAMDEISDEYRSDLRLVSLFFSRAGSTTPTHIHCYVPVLCKGKQNNKCHFQDL